jgi:hypothetical protein
MKLVTQQASRRWVLQAYLAACPSSPRWSEIEFTAIQGWTNYQHWSDGSKLWRDPRLTGDFSKWWFVSPEAARSVLEELGGYEQDYFLRVIERQSVMTEVALAGADIENGTVVRKPDGRCPTFMGKPVPGCMVAMPERIS